MKRCFKVNEEDNVDLLVLSTYLSAFRDVSLRQRWGRNVPYGIMEYDRGYCRFCPGVTDWTNAGRSYVHRLLREPVFRRRLIQNVEKLARDVITSAARLDRQLSTAQVTRQQGARQIDELFASMRALNVVGFIIPIVEIPFAFLSDALGKIVAQKRGERELGTYLTALLEPDQLTYSQREQRHMIALADAARRTKGLPNALAQRLSISELRRRFPAFARRVDRHVQHYAWITFSYRGPLVSHSTFLQSLRKHVTNPAYYAARVRSAVQKPVFNRHQKRAFVRELHLTRGEQQLFADAAVFMHHKVLRKEVNGYAAAVVYRAVDRWRTSLGLSRAQAEYLTADEFISALRGKPLVSSAELTRRTKYCTYAWTPNGEVVFTGQHARSLFKRWVQPEQPIHLQRILHGQTACIGDGSVVRGVVCIVNRRSDMKRMRQGNILVSIATTPELLPAMKKAAALVTDMGGLTCHAAIVSRELGTPCVIGTKYATKIVKNGDHVEVDAARGIVKKL